MKTLLSFLFTSLFFITALWAQDLANPKGGGTLDVVSIHPGDGFSDIDFEGQISGYGSVYITFKVSSINTSKTSGVLDGQARTILNDGTLLSTPLKGTWKRSGTLLKFYFTDALNNGAMNFVMWDVDLLKKTADVNYYELHSANE